ncbi:hypothetical protein D3C76_1287450 [compost metagenome]
MLGARLSNASQAEGETQRNQRHVQQKHPAPAQGTDQQATGHRADRQTQAVDRQQNADCTTALLRRPGIGDNGRSGGVQYRAGGALHKTPDVEQLNTA